MDCRVSVGYRRGAALLRFPLQRLQHPEHVHGELGELGLFAGRPHDEDLLQAERHLGRPFAGRRREGAQSGTGNATFLNGGIDTL